MIIFKRAEDIRRYLASKQKEGVTTGFVPTMGALHPGHISLIETANLQSDISICSIFVNPTQFNDPKDFKQYPHTIEKDIVLLEKAGCQLLFLPSVDEIYPDGIGLSSNYNIGYLETVLEGKYRPGHFQGVCQVVHRLLNIVQPDKLFLGQKDYQQCMVIKRLITLIECPTELAICPTLREQDGLALSSRNMRLSDTERKKAGGIYKALHTIQEELKPGSLTNLKSSATNYLAAEGFKVDYVEIANAGTLELVNVWDGKTALVALAAAFLNEVRLIDNLLVN